VSSPEDAPPSRRLPPGSHGIPAEVVARNQRERLIAAMAEVCAEKGYAECSVADVVKRAGVSSVTFYEQFADKRDCLLAAHRQLLGRLLEEVDRARGTAATPGEQAQATIATAFRLFAADPPSARLLTTEVLAAGPAGARRHDAVVTALAERLRGAAERGAEVPPGEWARAAGLLALAGHRVMAGEAGSLPALAEELLA
jgi:AcrR family transcriptional regulator